MNTYIGTKLVEAEPVYRCIDGRWNVSFIRDPEKAFPCYPSVEEGYRILYPDGYESWCPKETFDRYYLQLTPNSEAKTDQPSISQKMVDDFIAETWTDTLGEKTTVVRAVLQNGFEIVESSSCVSPENYDEIVGRNICLDKIKDKIWTLLGFLLQTAVNGCNRKSME